MPKHQIVPKVGNSGLNESLATAHTAVIVTIPGAIRDRSDNSAKPAALEVYFLDSSDEPCEGRIAFAATEDIDMTDVDGTDVILGYHKRDRQDSYFVPFWAKYVYLASPETGATAKGSWLYE